MKLGNFQKITEIDTKHPIESAQHPRPHAPHKNIQPRGT